MRVKKLLIAGMFVLPFGPGLLASASAKGALTLKVGRLTVDTALTMAKAAMLDCRKQGYQVAVTVVDREGIPQVSLRDTLAPPLALRFSINKAYTSAMFDAKGSALADEKRYVPLARAGEHLVFGAGSVPIEAGGMYYGAIGVSGTPSGKIDEDCASAGLAAVQDELEMQ